MSINTILGQFCKCGIWNKYNRRVHALPTKAAKEYALYLIQQGSDPDKAIRKAKRSVTK